MSGFINFDERVALVTGAGSRRGIGFWTAKLIGLNGGKSSTGFHYKPYL